MRFLKRVQKARGGEITLPLKNLEILTHNLKILVSKCSATECTAVAAIQLRMRM